MKNIFAYKDSALLLSGRTEYCRLSELYVLFSEGIAAFWHHRFAAKVV